MSSPTPRACPGPFGHNDLVIYRRLWPDWFRKSYWTICIHCDRMKRHGSEAEAQGAVIAQSAFMGVTSRSAWNGEKERDDAD